MTVFPRKWRPQDPYTPADFNVFVRDSFNDLARRVSNWKNEEAGATTLTWSNTTWAEHPDVNGTGQAILQLGETPANVYLFLKSLVRHNTSGAIVYYDVYWENRGFYLSSGNGTPLDNGIVLQEINTITQNLGVSMVFPIKNVPPGAHTFKLWVRTNTGIASERREDGPFYFVASSF